MFFLDWPLYQDFHPAFIAVFMFIGALFGSFFNVLAQRWGAAQIAQNDQQSVFWLKIRGVNASLPENGAKSLMGGRSSCPHCQKPIPLYRNIPVLGWLLLRGKSACCQKPIHIRYLISEILYAGIFGAVAFTVGPSMYGLFLALLLSVALLIATVDLKDGFIPDGALLWLGAIALGLTTHAEHGLSSADAIGWMLGVGIVVLVLFYALSKLAGKGVAGGADQYLLAVSAAVQGPLFLQTLPILVIALIITASLVKSGKVERGIFTKLIDSQKSVPAGPAICLAMACGVFMRLYGVTLA